MKEIYEFFRRPSLHFGEIRLKKDEHSGIALITFDYPPKRNAISGTFILYLYILVNFSNILCHDTTPKIFCAL